ncbi:MAG TPA: glycine--tRNA ligase subunit beta [Candidatus Acidoferrales bacterium]|nr:glycine--tRNA ligase subunit beta [Candidatus Acidoferrales bacterium]
MTARGKKSEGRGFNPAATRRAPRGTSAPEARAAEFLFELGCEEIPAWMIEPACTHLKASLEKSLAEASLLETSGIACFGGPRRLTVIVPALRLNQADVVKEFTGPPKSSAYDAQGNPTRAAEGFAASKGVSVKELYVVTLPKGEFIAARQTILGRPAAAVLADILPRTLAEIPWPKTMTWPVLTRPGGEGPAPGNPRFIRPVRWILAILGGRVVPCEFAGVKSSDRTDGHRTLGKAAIRVSNAAGYRALLRKNFVLVDPAERRQKIERELAAIAARHGVLVHADAELLSRVAYLNEYPSVILGGFHPEFLTLPQEILITVMRDHQKYFALENSSGGLAPHFLAVINSDRDRAGKMRQGHERVLRARFADAKFFWDSDMAKCRLADNLSKLDAVTYEASLGSYGLKVKRMRHLLRELKVSVPESAPAHAELKLEVIDRAASLAKCDLVTDMVREFTELQGAVGGLYARAQGESAVVADAIYDHYRPSGLDDDLPRNLAGCVLAFADKLDALVACFAVGKIPSGSSDPFALRRAAAGIVRISAERRVRVSLGGAVRSAAAALAAVNPAVRRPATLEQQVSEFLADRARFYFHERRGYALDEVKAAMAAGSDDLVDLADRLEALHRVRPTENFPPLAAAFKRIRNILEKSAAKEAIPDAPDPAHFAAEEERALHSAAQETAHAAAQFRQAHQYQPALARIAALRPAVDRFFDKVLVMAEDPAVRANRLSLLRNLLREFSTIADFSEIVTDSTAPKKS